MPTLALIALLRLPAYAEYLISFAVLVGSIATLLQLSRRSELVVMRAGGMIVWQFLRPGHLRRLSSSGSSRPWCSIRWLRLGAPPPKVLFAEAFGKEANLLRSHSGTSWLRQNGADGQSVISAALASNRGLRCTGVIGLRVRRPTATSWSGSTARARDLHDGFWEIRDAWVVRLGREPEKFDTLSLVHIPHTGTCD